VERKFSAALYGLLACWLSFAAAAHAQSAPTLPPAQLRCGWFDNPSPQNATLTDRQAQWLISEQGSHSAQGTWPPPFTKGQQVRYGIGSYGYGCACMKVTVDQDQRRIMRIVSTQAKPLAQCRRDRALKSKEPVIPK
jgi:hypothetical protein